MKLEAVVHPTSVSENDPNFDPSIHIAVEVLSSASFKKKMIGLPVTAYHHDTMKAVNVISRRKKELTADNMRLALIELNESLPGPLELARTLLKKRKIPGTSRNIWEVLPEVIAHARGPGVLGSVTDFWRDGDQWLVAVEINPQKISSFQMKLIKKGGALGEVSLTHVVLDGRIEPLELSFTIQGLRKGSAINRIVSASLKHHAMADMMLDQPLVVEEVCETEQDPIRRLYNKLELLDRQQEKKGESGPSLQSEFLATLANVKSMSVQTNKVNETRLADLEKALKVIEEGTILAFSEIGPQCFGKTNTCAQEEWSKDPRSLATANQLILAAAANNMNKRKRESDELDEVLKDVSGGPPRVIAASRAKTSNTPPEDEFWKELRTMRAALKSLP
jgi:hypothetical protein